MPEEQTDINSLEYKADCLYARGSILRRHSKYDKAVDCLNRAVPLYEKLIQQAKSPEKKQDYLGKYVDCLQKLAIETFMPGFIEEYGKGHWLTIIKKLVEASQGSILITQQEALFEIPQEKAH